MSTKQTSCPTCGSADIREMVRVPAFPAILFPTEAEEKSKVATATLIAMGCVKCDHIFLAEIDPIFYRALYLNYYHLYPFSNLESMTEAYRKPFERVFRFFTGRGPERGKKLLEIGCSSPAQLEFFGASGFDCSGISPDVSSTNSDCIIDGFYETYTFSTKFDHIVSRFNLEHIVDLEFFLNKVCAELEDGGLFFVQVPNVQCFLASGMLGVFAHEHPHYFSRNSLSLILERTGFEIELILANVSDPSIIAVARKRRPIAKNTERVKNNLAVASKVLDVMGDEEHSSFLFYGASLSLCTLLYASSQLAEFEGRLHVVDDNPILLGRVMPNTTLKIAPLTSIADPSRFILFVFLNSIYHSKVLPRVKGAGFKKIFYLDGAGVREYSKDD